ncbi:hypothetical protein C7999DRAFT_39984 [Corynascus novoguineensis]|uniref:Extracellular membrane protein CFEM domain-containing protein n=1 Tax=Corynascus novoguineensis TaxID=1126955 RepID=A0AAN7CVL6_9PEZI|nr:hypothetical protein C7999DRAFT_39984 [Corynascus novoguineensis]
MKNIAISVLLGHAALAQADAWWEGAPECAHDCFNSWWSSASAWPAPTSYCSASQGASVSNCLRTACSATPTAAVSYSSLSSSLCSRWSSCSSAGATGVYTVSAPAITGDWPGPGRWPRRPDDHRDDDDDHDHDHDHDDNDGNDDWDWDWDRDDRDDHDRDDRDDWDDIFDDNDHDDDDDDLDDFRSRWSQFTRTWTGGTYTVTGCEWDGNVWAGGPGGYGAGGVAGSPWGPWGSGWSQTTVTQTITRVVTVAVSSGSGGAPTSSLSTSVGLGAVVLAVSGDVTSTSIVGAAVETGAGSGGEEGVDNSNGTGGSRGSGGASATGDANSATTVGRDSALGVKVVGAFLGGVVAVAALL